MMWRRVVLFFFLFSFFACCFFNTKERARGEKKMMKCFVFCSFFFSRERELFFRDALPPLFLRTKFSHSHTKKYKYVYPRVHRNAQSLQKSGRDHQRGGQGESAGTNFVHGRSRLGVLAHSPRRIFFAFFFYRQNGRSRAVAGEKKMSLTWKRAERFMGS